MTSTWNSATNAQNNAGCSEARSATCSSLYSNRPVRVERTTCHSHAGATRHQNTTIAARVRDWVVDDPGMVVWGPMDRARFGAKVRSFHAIYMLLPHWMGRRAGELRSA